MDAKIELINVALNQFLSLKTNKEKDDWFNKHQLDPELIFDIFRQRVIKGNLEDVCYFVESGKVDPTAWDNCAIREACGNGHLDIVKYLVEYTEADPTAEQNDPICIACDKGHIEVVLYLIDKTTADATVFDNYVLQSALSKSNANFVFFLTSLPAVKKALDLDIELKFKVEEFKFKLKETFKNKLSTLCSHLLLFSLVAEVLNDVKSKIAWLAIPLIQQDMGLNSQVMNYLIKRPTNKEKFALIIVTLIYHHNQNDPGLRYFEVCQLKDYLNFTLKQPEDYFDKEVNQQSLISNLRELCAPKCSDSIGFFMAPKCDSINRLERLLEENQLSSDDNLTVMDFNSQCPIQ